MTRPTPAQVAKAHAATLTINTITEADYDYIRKYVFTFGYPAAEDIYGASYVAAAMLPTE
jgi:hypothetical protein